jgi:hypothetical protein
MKEKDFNELNEETRGRGVERSSEIKIAEVSTGKKKRAKKPTAEATTEPNIAQIYLKRPLKGLKNMNSVRALETPPVLRPTEKSP